MLRPQVRLDPPEQVRAGRGGAGPQIEPVPATPVREGRLDPAGDVAAFAGASVTFAEEGGGASGP